MNEPRHDFLAGARLAAQQHGCFSGCHLCGLRERLPPRALVADLAAESRSRVHPPGERANVILESRRALRGFIRALARLQAFLAHETDRETRGYPAADDDIRFFVNARLERVE